MLGIFKQKKALLDALYEVHPVFLHPSGNIYLKGGDGVCGWIDEKKQLQGMVASDENALTVLIELQKVLKKYR